MFAMCSQSVEGSVAVLGVAQSVQRALILSSDALGVCRGGSGFFLRRCRFASLGGLGTPRGMPETCLRNSLAGSRPSSQSLLRGNGAAQSGPTPRCADRSAPEAFDSHREGLGSPGEREIVLG